MLVLTQKEGEILQVGDDVRIYIKRVKGNWVRLCIDAPREVEIQRIPGPSRVVESRREAEQGMDQEEIDADPLVFRTRSVRR